MDTRTHTHTHTPSLYSPNLVKLVQELNHCLVSHVEMLLIIFGRCVSRCGCFSGGGGRCRCRVDIRWGLVIGLESGFTSNRTCVVDKFRHDRL